MLIKKMPFFITLVLFCLLILVAYIITFKPIYFINNTVSKNNNEKIFEKKVSKEEFKTTVYNDWLCIPGERVGPINSNTSEKDLKVIFGDKNVITENSTDAEGNPLILTFVYKETKNVFIIRWVDEEKRDKPMWVGITGDEGSDWKTKEGIKIGTTIEELNKINGKPFIFSGFGWDYAGTVTSWENGELGKYKGFGITIGMKKEGPMKYLGDKGISSDDPDLNNYGALVAEIHIRLLENN